MRIGYWWESRKERHHKEDLDVGGRIMLKCVVQCLGFFWNRLAACPGISDK
jgi:hypothetical protein